MRARLARVPGRPTRIAAVADTNPDALCEFGAFFKVDEGQRYADYQKMLDRVAYSESAVASTRDFV